MLANYTCLTCELEFEFLKIRSYEVVECPKCEEKRPEKLIRATVHKGGSFTLKGRGWYKDGYKK